MTKPDWEVPYGTWLEASPNMWMGQNSGVK